jgi:hypothetical protein
MERWNDGRVECWNFGRMERWSFFGNLVLSKSLLIITKEIQLWNEKTSIGVLKIFGFGRMLSPFMS